jgi:hypothetical protein
MASDPDTKRDAELRIRIPTHDRAFTDLCVWFSSGPGWIAARIGSDGPGDSIRIWPLRRAFHLTCPRVADTGLAHLAGLIRSLSADGGVTRHRCAAW